MSSGMRIAAEKKKEYFNKDRELEMEKENKMVEKNVFQFSLTICWKHMVMNKGSKNRRKFYIYCRTKEKEGIKLCVSQ
jgi:hypothetical protein